MQSKVAASMDLAERLERIAPLRSNPQPEHAHHVCNMCGKPSEITICDECSEPFASKSSLERNKKSRVTPGPAGNRLATLEHCCGIRSAVTMIARDVFVRVDPQTRA